MTRRRRKHLLLAVNAALVATIVAACIAAVAPLQVGGDTDGAGAGRSGDPGGGVRLVGPREAYAVISKRDLRKPLYDARPAAAVKAPEPKFSARLLGTVTDPGYSAALFRTADGKEQFVSVGETVAGGVVTAIAECQATVEFGGKRIALTVEDERGSR